MRVSWSAYRTFQSILIDRLSKKSSNRKKYELTKFNIPSSGQGYKIYLIYHPLLKTAVHLYLLQAIARLSGDGNWPEDVTLQSGSFKGCLSSSKRRWDFLIHSIRVAEAWGDKCWRKQRTMMDSKIKGGARGVMVIVVGNGHGNTSSNPGRDWLHFP